MTEQEQRIAIARECGLTAYPDRPDYGFDKQGVARQIPDYLRDLNACREMEEHLEPDQQAAYALLLSMGIINPVNPMDLFWMVHKAPEMKCEAFLRVKGLWKE